MTQSVLSMMFEDQARFQSVQVRPVWLPPSVPKRVVTVHALPPHGKAPEQWKPGTRMEHPVPAERRPRKRWSVS